MMPFADIGGNFGTGAAALAADPALAADLDAPGSSGAASLPAHHRLVSPLVERVQSILADAQRRGDPVALMLVHAAGVDRVDARHGYLAGNSLSNKIAGVLRTQALLRHDELEILSRDEFVCILPSVASPGVAVLAAQRVMALLGGKPVQFGAASEPADVAIGIAIAPQHGLDAGELLQRAKQAMLTARARGTRVSICETEEARPFADQSRFASRMQMALDENRLGLHYMPQVSLRTGRLSGAEALLRWTDDVLGAVSPYAAVQMAESSGLIERLSQWIIGSAVQQCAEFQHIDPAFTISVNVSPSNLHERDLPLHVEQALRTWSVNSNNLVIEITESSMIANQHATNEVLRELKSHGTRLAIDDFGTGYSSMYYLAQMPLDELKIDQSFIGNMLEAASSAKIVRSLIDLAHNFELSVVAEGVESKAVMAALAQLGCDHAQGYHIGEAMPAAELAVKLRDQAGRA